MDHQFRSVTFGGFHKQDVLDFLESSAKEHTQQVEELQGKLNECEEERLHLDGLVREQEEQLGICREELETEQTRSQELDEKLSGAQERVTALEQELAEVRKQLEEEQSRVAALTPDAQAYVTLKERTAGVELEAHRRAQEIETRGRDQAQRLHRDTGRWLKGVEREYDELRTRVETTVAHAAEELSKAGTALERVGRLLDERSTDLETLERAYAAEEEKVPAPVPLDEK